MQARHNFTLEGEKELRAALKKIKKQAPEELQKMLFSASNETRNTAIRSIQVSKSSGRFAKRRSVLHEISPPGGPPNTDSGKLVRNITVKKIENGYDVGSREGAPHGFWLEFKESSHGGRKWLEPAFLKGLEHLKRYVETWKAFK